MGNFSRDTFNKLKHYVGVRLQQGVPIVDADWNELEDIRKYELQAFLKWFVGNGIPQGNDGFHILPAVGSDNDFVIKGGGGTAEGAGRCLVEGWDVINESDINYTTQHLPLPTLTTPTSARTDIVYLDVWEREVNAAEDFDQLVNPAIGIETCVRLKREWVVRVAEGANALPAAPTGHVFYVLAQLNRPANAAAITAGDIVDHRLTGLSIVSLATEIADARGMKGSLGNRLDESLTRGGQLRQQVVGNDQVKSDAAIAESKIQFSNSGHDHSSGNGALIGMESLKESVRSKLVDFDRMFKVPLLKQTVFHGQYIPGVGGGGGVAFDGTYIWVANWSGSVSKIDVITNAVAATVTVGSGSYGVAFDGTYIWVANFLSNSVSKIDVATNAVAATVTVGTNPFGIAFDGTYIWVANSNSNSVSKIDVTTNAVAATVTVGTYPFGIAFDGTYIWVANYTSSSVSKIDVTTNAVAATVTVGSGPYGVAFDGTYIWVANFLSNSVSKIDVATNAVAATVAVGTGPFGIAFDGTYIWVGNYSSNSVSRVDIYQNIMVDSIGIGDHPYLISFDGSHIWIPGYNSLTKLRVRV